MVETHEEQITRLNDRLQRLENESRRLLDAVRWSGRVRIILVTCLVLFLFVFGALYFWLYLDVRNNRMAEYPRLIGERPEQFSEPLTRQAIQLFEMESPGVADVFLAQFNKDRATYVDLIEKERKTLTDNIVRSFEAKLNETSKSFLEEHQEVLAREFPELRDEKKMALIKDNLQDIYERIGRRYHVHFMRDRLDSLIAQIDEFPRIEPKASGVPVTEQIFSEMLELLRMMLINSENYLSPEELAEWKEHKAEMTGVGDVSETNAAVDDSGMTGESTGDKPSAETAEPPKTDDAAGDGDASADEGKEAADNPDDSSPDDGEGDEPDDDDDDSGDGSDGRN